MDQSVHGNDYWQAYSDVDGGSFTLIYNVHNRGTNTYRLNDNQRTLDAAVGTVINDQPPEIEAASGDVAAKFTLSGGSGYTTVIIHGLSQPTGWLLQKEVYR